MSLTDDLEKLGEPAVRKRLQDGHFGQPTSQTYSSVQEWLRGKEIERINDTARSARTIAIIAIIIAAISIIKDIVIALLTKK
jgi:type IV secretory pathway component VirB8